MLENRCKIWARPTRGSWSPYPITGVLQRGRSAAGKRKRKSKRKVDMMLMAGWIELD